MSIMEEERERRGPFTSLGLDSEAGSWYSKIDRVSGERRLLSGSTLSVESSGGVSFSFEESLEESCATVRLTCWECEFCRLSRDSWLLERALALRIFFFFTHLLSESDQTPSEDEEETEGGWGRAPFEPFSGSLPSSSEEESQSSVELEEDVAEERVRRRRKLFPTLDPGLWDLSQFWVMLALLAFLWETSGGRLLLLLFWGQGGVSVELLELR